MMVLAPKRLQVCPEFFAELVNQLYKKIDPEIYLQRSIREYTILIVTSLSTPFFCPLCHRICQELKLASRESELASLQVKLADPIPVNLIESLPK